MLTAPRGRNPKARAPFGALCVQAVLARLLSDLVASNEQRAAGTQTSASVDTPTAFHGRRPPLISLERYLERIFKYAACSPACYVLAFMYLERMCQVRINPLHSALTRAGIARILWLCIAC